MTETTRSPGSTTPEHGLAAAGRIASDIKRRWTQGEQPNMSAILVERPELKKHRSVVLDLACTEYWKRVAAGESLDAAEFAQRFPALEKSLYFLIEVRKLLSGNPGWASQEAIPWPEPGERFLEFSLIAELGRGTFARVFLASQPALSDRLVAVKIAPQGQGEAGILAKLRHPNIVPIYSIQEEEETGLTAVCMPYLGQATLSDVLDRAFADSQPPASARIVLDAVKEINRDCDIPADDAFDRVLRTGLYVEGIGHIGAQLCDALTYAHSRGICHRDLKPSNVLVSSEGRPLLLDFNLSSDQELATYRAGGTLPYMAPEQLRTVILDTSGSCSNADPRSDLFSVGVICYELLTGSPPFGPIPWDRPIEQIAEHLLSEQKEGPQPIRVKNPQVDKRLARLLHDCLAFEADDRPQTAAALAVAFRRQLTPVRRTARRLVRHRRLVAASALAMTFAALAVGVWLAIRDPYSVRCFERGVQYTQQGRWELAVGPLSESILTNPKNAEAWLARGHAYQRLGNFPQAQQDYMSAFELSRTHRAMAGVGYCLSKLKYHREAATRYRMAQEMGDDSAATHNNMGFSLFELRRPQEAETSLRRALAKDGRLAAARRNLLKVLHDEARLGQPLPEGVLGDVAEAIAAVPPSADLFLDAAAICAAASTRDPRLIGQALAYLENGCAHGLDPQSVEQDPLFAALTLRPEFRTIRSAERGVAGATAALDPLVDPL